MEYDYGGTRDGGQCICQSNKRKQGSILRELLSENGFTVREVQRVMGFENPQAIYKWISGKTLPSIDNLVILSRLLHTSIEDILVIDGDIVIFGTLLLPRPVTIAMRSVPWTYLSIQMCLQQ